MDDLFNIQSQDDICVFRTTGSAKSARCRADLAPDPFPFAKRLGRVARLFGLALAVLVSLFVSGEQSQAADRSNAHAPPPATLSPLAGWEIRAGGYAHNPFLNRESRSADLNLEVLTPKLYQTADPGLALLLPRVNFGTTTAFASRKTSLGYAGFAWTIEPFDRVFIEGTVGVAFHDGSTGNIRRIDGRAELGCNPLIHSAGTLGYRLTDNWSVMLTVQHVSNGGLCSRNQGLTHIGGRIGYRF